MKLFGYEFNKQKPVVKTPFDPNETIIKLFELSRVELPAIVERRNQDWVSFGDKNNYPQQLIKYLSTSAIHNAIVLTKAKMQSGNDTLFNGMTFDDFTVNLDPKNTEYLRMFYKDPSGCGITLNELNYCLSYDWQIFGAMAIEIIWSVDFTRIAQVKHIDVSRIRSGKLDDDREVCSYYYSNNWNDTRNNTPLEIPAFNKDNKEDYRQLLYVKAYKPGLDYYGEPGYSSALSWINIDSKMGEFHLSNIENGFSPSMSIKFYKKPGSPEERDEISRNVVKQFAGARNAGKAMVFFSDGKELAPDIDPIQTSNLDQMFLVLGEQVVQQIISGHRVTSPLLMGIATPGKLGYSNELATAWNLFDKEVIRPDQNVLERVLNKISLINGYDAVITIAPLLTTEDLTLTKA